MDKGTEELFDDMIRKIDSIQQDVNAIKSNYSYEYYTSTDYDDIKFKMEEIITERGKGGEVNLCWDGEGFILKYKKGGIKNG